jgi:uncharacterized damage-inducible protein DinB
MSNETPVIDDLILLLDQERRALLDTVAQVPPADRERRPSESAWSIAEVLDHLARVERGVAKLIASRGRERPSGSAPAVPLDVERVRSRVERIEAPERIRPAPTATSGEALQALEEARTALRQALEVADPVALREGTYPHPLLGVLTLGDWVAFVAHHEARHAEQISAIAEALIA